MPQTTPRTTVIHRAIHAPDPQCADLVRTLAPWFHNLHLPDGTQTAPGHVLGDYPACTWREIAASVPEDLVGWRCLDVGCNAGFHAFELARRGATVLGIDPDPHHVDQARWAAGRFGLAHRVEFLEMPVYDLARCDEAFDLVLFMGVFHHLRYPLLGLDAVARTVKRLMVFQTLTMPGLKVLAGTDGFGVHERGVLADPGWPKMAFIEHRLQDDPTVWWAPNHAAVEAMLRSSGMRVSSRPAHDVYVCEPDLEHPSCIATWNAAEFRSAAGLAPARRTMTRAAADRHHQPESPCAPA